MTIKRLTEISKEHFHEHQYLNCHIKVTTMLAKFLMDKWGARNEPVHGFDASIPATMVGIPVVYDDTLPMYTWQLCAANDAIIEEGSLEQDCDDGH